MKRLLPWIVLAACAGGLAACNNSNPSVTPTPGPTCSPPGQTVLVYPAPNASGVVNSNGEVVIGSTVALPSTWDIVITDAVNPNGATLGTVQTATPPFPSPNQTPAFPNPQYQSASSGVPFASSQVVTVFVNDPNSNCSPDQIGSFST